MPWTTYWMDPTGVSRVGLRRYSLRSGGATCGTGVHSAVAWLDLEVPSRPARKPPGRPTFDADDSRWPVTCAACAYVFRDEADFDERQVWTEPIYQVAGTGELRALHNELHPPDIASAGPGAMWDADWFPEHWRGWDGISLMVRCPRNDGAGAGSDWPVDMPSQGGGRWARSGDPKTGRVTVSPSISIGTPGEPGAYHGWLQDGVLSDPI